MLQLAVAMTILSGQLFSSFTHSLSLSLSPSLPPSPSLLSSLSLCLYLFTEYLSFPSTELFHRQLITKGTPPVTSLKTTRPFRRCYKTRSRFRVWTWMPCATQRRLSCSKMLISKQNKKQKIQKLQCTAQLQKIWPSPGTLKYMYEFSPMWQRSPYLMCIYIYIVSTG